MPSSVTAERQDYGGRRRWLRVEIELAQECVGAVGVPLQRGTSSGAAPDVGAQFRSRGIKGRAHGSGVPGGVCAARGRGKWHLWSGGKASRQAPGANDW